jgi:hypothetical protein
MSTRSFGMVGKTYRTASEAFKDAEYASGITKFHREIPRALNHFEEIVYNVSISAFLGGMAIGLIYWITR